uniref:Threonylcarbamoyl-AMP synthase n=1 Tax=Anas platyrhynchos TaxID=8839 RepID=A0A8B9T2U6_ANAPL
TDTVYGVACLAQDSRAVRSIYGLKGALAAAFHLSFIARFSLRRYCHVNRSEELNKDLNPFTSLVGVRIPNHPFIRELARACSGPLALTSANISSQARDVSLLISGGGDSRVQYHSTLWSKTSCCFCVRSLINGGAAVHS